MNTCVRGALWGAFAFGVALTVIVVSAHEDCHDVTEQLTVVSKTYIPQGSGICIPLRVEGAADVFVPLNGGSCVGSIEVIPAQVTLHLSNGKVMSVTEAEYAAAKVGDALTVNRVSCNGQ